MTDYSYNRRKKDKELNQAKNNVPTVKNNTNNQIQVIKNGRNVGFKNTNHNIEVENNITGTKKTVNPLEAHLAMWKSQREKEMLESNTQEGREKFFNKYYKEKGLDYEHASEQDKANIRKISAENFNYTNNEAIKKNAASNALNIVDSSDMFTVSKDDALDRLKKFGYTGDDIEDVAESLSRMSFNTIRENRKESAKAIANELPVLASLGALGYQNMVKPVEGVINLGMTAFGADKEDLFQFGSDLNAGLREGVRDNIDSNFWKAVYDLGMGAGDLGVQSGMAYVTGGGSALPAAIQGFSAANDALSQSLDNGNSNLQALLTGVGSGTVTGLSSKIGLDKLFGGETAKTLGGAVIKSAVTEAAEEATENILSSAVDRGVSALFNGTSDHDRRVAEYMASGMSEDDAEKQYYADRVKEVGMDAAAGAIFGGAFGGINYASGVKNGTINPVADELINGKKNKIPALEDVKINRESTPAEKNRILSAYIGNENSIEQNIKDGNIFRVPLETDVSEEPYVRNAPYSNISVENNIPNNTVNVNPVNVLDPQSVGSDGAERIRGFSESHSKNTDIPQEIRNQLKEDTYKQLSNKQTKATADSIYDSIMGNAATPEQGMIAVENQFRDMLNKHEASSVVLGYRLAQDYFDLGGDINNQHGLQIIEDMSKELTKAGEFTQASYITMMRNDPKIVMASLQREIAKINDNGQKKFGKKWKDFSLTDQEIQALNNVKTGDKNAINEIVSGINQRMADEYPHTFWEKLDEGRRMVMLLNPRTHVRNTVANAAQLLVRSTTDRVSALGQNAFALFNNYLQKKGKGIDDFMVTQSFKGGNKQQKKTAGEVFERVKGDFLDDGKYQEGLKGIEKGGRMYKDSKIGTSLKQSGGKVLNWVNDISNGRIQRLVDSYDANAKGSVLENARQLDYWLLGAVEDDPFVKRNFVNRLASYMDAQNISNIEDIPDDAIQLAMNEALKATFKDNNRLTEALSGVKKKSGKLGDIVLPFTKTPANLAVRGFDYSPAGLAQQSYKFAKALKTGKAADVSAAIDDLSKGVTGTAAIALGYLLAKNGIITTSLPKDKDEKKFKQMQGYQEYALNINGKYYTYDWAQPVAIPLLLGTAIYEGINDDDKAIDSALGRFTHAAKEGTISAFDAWFNLSPLQTVSKLMGGNSSYGDDSTGENLYNTLAEYPLSLIPSAMGAGARTADTTYRNTYDQTSKFNTLVNQAKAKVPFLSDTLPASYDTWGRERKRNNSTGEAAFAQFLNPGTLGNANKSPIDDEIMRIYESTGEKAVFPMASDYKVSLGNGEEKTGEKSLNNAEYSELQKAQGQKSYEYAESFINSNAYKNMTDNERAKALASIYSAAKDATQHDLYGKPYSMGKAELEAYNKGASEYAKYLNDKANIKRLNNEYGTQINYDTYQKKQAEYKGGIEQYIKDSKAAEKKGLTLEQYNKHKKEGDLESFAKVNQERKNLNEKYDIDISNEVYEGYKKKGATDSEIKFMSDMKKKAKSNSEVLTFLSNQNMSDAQRSKYAYLNASKSTLESKYVQRGVSEFGESAYYQIFNNKAKADLDGNGSLSNKEAKQYVKDTFQSEKERAVWYFVLTGKNY